MFLIGALAGLMVIGNVQNFAKSLTDGFTAAVLAYKKQQTSQ
jgi:hypothetical protein